MFLNLNQVKSPLDPRCRRSPSLRWVLGDPSYENRRKMSQENQGLVNTYALMIGHPGLNSKVVQNYPPSPLQHSLSRTMLLGFCRSSQQVLKKPTYSKIGNIDRIIHRPNPWKRFSCFFFFWRKRTNINVSFICKLLERGSTAKCQWARRALIIDYTIVQHRASNLASHVWKLIKSKFHCEDISTPYGWISVSYQGDGKKPF